MTKTLEDWSIRGDWEVFRLFRTWERSNYVTLPYAGGWLDQPQYIIDGFETLLAVSAWWRFNNKLEDAGGLPRLDT